LTRQHLTLIEVFFSLSFSSNIYILVLVLVDSKNTGNQSCVTGQFVMYIAFQIYARHHRKKS